MSATFPDTASGTTTPATTSANGIVRLSAAPADPDAPVAVETADARLTNARTPTGAAGGVLSGTFPNPTFAADMATQLELDAALAGLAALATTTQPLDSDLTAIAALTTAAYGRALLALADAAAARTAVGLGNVDNTSDANKPVSTAQAAADALALAKASNLSDLANAATARTNLGLGTAATQATGAFDAAGSAAAAQAAAIAASQPLDSDLTAIAALTTTSFGRSLLTQADAAAARAALGVNAAAGEQTAVLAADLAAINTQTTLQDITGLGLTLGSSATEIWLVKHWLIVSSANTAMDLKLGFSAPASCTMQWGDTGRTWAGVATTSNPPASTAEGGTLTAGTRAGTFGLAVVSVVYGGGTAGTVQIRYAQNTSDAGNLQILKGSAMEAKRLAT